MLPRSPLRGRKQIWHWILSCPRAPRGSQKGQPFDTTSLSSSTSSDELSEPRGSFLGSHDLYLWHDGEREETIFWGARSLMTMTKWPPSFRSYERCAEQITSENWHTKQGTCVKPDTRNPARIRTCEKHTPKKINSLHVKSKRLRVAALA